MANRFMGGLLDRECPHGLGQKSWCVICNGRGIAFRPKPKKKKANETEKVVVPKCEICIKKAEKHGGHAFHRRYVPTYDPSTVHGRNPDRRTGNIQVRAVWDMTHTDDAGRKVCDECCNNRCSKCKAWDPTAPRVPVLLADKVARVDVTTYTLSETSGMHQHLHGTSVSGNIGWRTDVPTDI